MFLSAEVSDNPLPSRSSSAEGSDDPLSPRSNSAEGSEDSSLPRSSTAEGSEALLRPRSWGKRWRAAAAEAVEAALLLSIAFYPQPLSRLK